MVQQKGMIQLEHLKGKNFVAYFNFHPLCKTLKFLLCLFPSIPTLYLSFSYLLQNALLYVIFQNTMLKNKDKTKNNYKKFEMQWIRIDN